jgi:Secretion system C-terminal sorting domain
MKKYFLSLFLFLSSAISYTQWQPDVRLTNDSGESRTIASNAWSIASSGSIVHVVWYDSRYGHYEIYYKRSIDSGLNWGPDTRLTNSINFATSPSVVISGSDVHVVWSYREVFSEEIYYKRSTDSGMNWEPSIRLTTYDSTNSIFPSIAVSGSDVHVVWHGANIQYMNSTDSGESWGQVIQLTNSPLAAVGASVAVSGSNVHVVWMDNRDGNWEIYYKRSIDGGANWGTDLRLTNSTFYSGYSSIAVFNAVVHVVWVENDVFYKRSTDGGVSWEADIRLTDGYTTSSAPSIAVSDSVVHVGWTDWRDGAEIYYKRSTDSGVSWEPDTRLTNNTGNSLYPSVAVSGSVVHIAFTDERDGNKEIYYKGNPTGNLTGIKNNNSEIPEEFQLHQNYPNPFNPSTSIQYTIASRQFVQLKVYDVLGNEVATLVNEEKSPGTYEVEFKSSCHSREGGNLTSGIYFYQLKAGDYLETKKMILMK